MKKILIIRNDKLGDFVQALPAIALIKKAAPDWRISVLVPSYTEPLANICPYIDHIIVDAGKHANKSEQKHTQTEIQREQYHAVISLFSNTYNGLLVFKSRIPYRLAPATKLAQVFYNHRLTQRRSRSEKPEFEYNLDLAKQFLRDHGITIPEIRPPYVSISAETAQQRKQELQQLFRLPENTQLIFVHAGSGGSANNLSLAQYAQFIDLILQQFQAAHVILSAGPGETEQAQVLQQLCQTQARTHIYASENGLIHYTETLTAAALFIAGSTGTLHLAAALNRPTIGFFPAARTASSLRWQPINEPQRHLSFSAPAHAEHDLNQINIADIWKTAQPFIAKWIQAA